MTDSNKKSILKTITWRLLATGTTFLIGWWITGSIALGLGIATVEFWAKLVLYYLHERLWSNINV